MPDDTPTPSEEPQFNPVSPQPAPTPINSDLPEAALPPNPLVSSNEPAPKKKSKLLIVGLTIVVLIIIAGIAAYFLRSNSQQTTSAKKDIPYLTYGFSGAGDIGQIYPTETADDANTGLIDAQLFEGLVKYEDQTKIVPALATSWYNPNDTTWIFNLRHNVHFHSGRVMTATDVAYSINYAVAHQNNYQGSTNLEEADSISKVKALSPYQVEVTTNGPDAVLLNQLDYIYIIDSKAKVGSPNAGTGPYIVPGDKVNPNANSMNLVAFNDYWGGHVYTREVHIQEDATPNQLAEDVANGKIDLAGDFDSQQISTIKAKVKYYQPLIVNDLGVSFLNLNTENQASPLYHLAARQAITYALNIPAILKAGGINGIQASQLIPPALPGHDPSITSTPYDPAKAKQLLASVPNASNPISLYYPGGDGGQVNAIVKQLQAVGFNVKATEIDSVGTLVNQMLSGQGDMFYLTYTSNTLDGLDMINSIVGDGTPDYNNPTLNNLISQAGSTFNPATRVAILKKIEQLVAANVPAVALYSQIRTFSLTKPYVVQVSIPSTDTGTYFWQVYQK